MTQQHTSPDGKDKPVIVHGLRLDKNTPLYMIADMIINDWKNISPHALPYLRAMATLDTVSERYGFDSGKSIVLYFLSNATSWRGEVARQVKATLNLQLKSAQ